MPHQNFHHLSYQMNYAFVLPRSKFLDYHSHIWLLELSHFKIKIIFTFKYSFISWIATNIQILFNPETLPIINYNFKHNKIISVSFFLSSLLMILSLMIWYVHLHTTLLSLIKLILSLSFHYFKSVSKLNLLFEFSLLILPFTMIVCSLFT